MGDDDVFFPHDVLDFRHGFCFEFFLRHDSKYRSFGIGNMGGKSILKIRCYSFRKPVEIVQVSLVLEWTCVRIDKGLMALKRT